MPEKSLSTIYTPIYTLPTGSVYIGIYIGIYTGTYNGQRKEACVQCALICTAADGSQCIPIYIPIYTNILVYSLLGRVYSVRTLLHRR